MKLKFPKQRIGKKRTTREWTTKEEKYLNGAYGTIGASEIAAFLKRPIKSIYAKAHKMGIANVGRPGRAAKLIHCRETIKHLIINCGMGASQIAKELDTNQRHIHWIVDDEFEKTVKKHLIENGKENYREYRRNEAINRANQNQSR